ncbi:MAG: hypothetical protein HC802_11155 [Caldilineaceae bacterium]|nr:hypothetical protein [Caldilineaceae bacterium]
MPNLWLQRPNGQWAHPVELQAMGRTARAEYEHLYSAEVNYSALIAIYERAIESKDFSRRNEYV